MENMQIDCCVLLGDKNYGVIYEGKLSFITGQITLDTEPSAAEQKGVQRVVEFKYDDKEYRIPLMMRKGVFYIKPNFYFESLKMHAKLEHLDEKTSKTSKKMKI